MRHALLLSLLVATSAHAQTGGLPSGNCLPEWLAGQEYVNEDVPGLPRRDCRMIVETYHLLIDCDDGGTDRVSFTLPSGWRYDDGLEPGENPDGSACVMNTQTELFHRSVFGDDVATESNHEVRTATVNTPVLIGLSEQIDQVCADWRDTNYPDVHVETWDTSRQRPSGIGTSYVDSRACDMTYRNVDAGGNPIGSVLTAAVWADATCWRVGQGVVHPNDCQMAPGEEIQRVRGWVLHQACPFTPQTQIGDVVTCEGEAWYDGTDGTIVRETIAPRWERVQ